MLVDMGDEEGWFTDPYGRHEARWLSLGEPTKLVRDDGIETYDGPPTDPPTEVPVRIEGDGSASAGTNDLRRADDAESGDAYDPQKAARAAWDTFDRSSGHL
jgi:hypothetical protein